jgi:magnesium transporter
MRRRKTRLVLKKRAAPGTAPGMLVVDPAAAATSITALTFRPEAPADGLRESHAIAAATLPALRTAGTVLWGDIVGLADHDEIQKVAAAFELHPLAVEDITNTHQRPKVEVYDKDLFIVFRMITPGGPVDGEQVSLVVGPGHVLTFQERPGDCFAPVRERLRRGQGRIRANAADYLAYALIDAAIDGYFPVLESMGEEIERLEDELLLQPTPQHVKRLHHLKRELLVLRRAIWPLRELLAALLRDETNVIAATTLPYLRDAYDHTVQLMDIVETYREITTGLLDVYLSSQSTRLNEVMKVLTIIATIFMPMSFIASLYGMNFDTTYPWNMPELGWPFGYAMALGTMAAIATGLVWWFKRKGWLGDGGGQP